MHTLGLLGTLAFIRRLQIEKYDVTNGLEPIILSLSSNEPTLTDGLGSGAVDAQTRMLLKCGYTLVSDSAVAIELVQSMDKAFPSLHLRRTLDRGSVTALLFDPTDECIDKPMLDLARMRGRQCVRSFLSRNAHRYTESSRLQSQRSESPIAQHDIDLLNESCREDTMV